MEHLEKLGTRVLIQNSCKGDIAINTVFARQTTAGFLCHTNLLVVLVCILLVV